MKQPSMKLPKGYISQKRKELNKIINRFLDIKHLVNKSFQNKETKLKNLKENSKN